MEDRELVKLNMHKDHIRKYISRLYGTTSVTAEASITEDLNKEVKKVSIEDLIELSKEFDCFGRCVFHYRLPIDIRINIDFSKATTVPEEERLSYWKEYKEKLFGQHLNPEEEYNKIILMACTLHVPINVAEAENAAKAGNVIGEENVAEAENVTEAENAVEVEQTE